MQFTKKLREPIAEGRVTCSIRIWKSPRVKAGSAYVMGRGFVVVDSIHEIGMDDITPALARRSGFSGVVELMKIAKHGAGERVFLVEFHYANERPR